MSLVGAWALSHLLTQAVELPIATLLLAETGAPLRRRLTVAALGTAFTHPTLWFLWPKVVPDYTLGVTSGEALILVCEAVLYALAVPASARQALVASAFANAASYLLGAWLLTGVR